MYFQEKQQKLTQEEKLIFAVIPRICTATALTLDMTPLLVVLNGSYKPHIQVASSHEDIEQKGKKNNSTQGHI